MGQIDLAYRDGHWVVDDAHRGVDPASAGGMEHAQRGFVKQISSFEIGGIPVGTPVAGGTIALLTSELVDGFMATQENADVLRLRPWIKLLAAWGLVGFGREFLGKEISTSAASFLVFDAARQILPLDDWLSQVQTIFRPAVTAANDAGNNDVVHDSHNPGPPFGTNVIRMIPPRSTSGFESMALSRNALAGV